jgi:hypothetical protein
MSRQNLDGQRQSNQLVGPGFQFQNETFINANGVAVDPNSPPMIFLNPAGAVNLLLPTSTLARKGLAFIFINLSGNIVTLQTDGGAGFTTAVTVPATGATRVVCTGDSSQVLGWRAW